MVVASELPDICADPATSSFFRDILRKPRASTGLGLLWLKGSVPYFLHSLAWEVGRLAAKVASHVLSRRNMVFPIRNGSLCFCDKACPPHP